MRFCYAHILVPYSDIITEAFSYSRHEQMQRPTVGPYTERVSAWNTQL